MGAEDGRRRQETAAEAAATLASTTPWARTTASFTAMDELWEQARLELEEWQYQEHEHEEEAGEQATAEEEEGPATGERAAEGEHEEDEEVSARESVLFIGTEFSILYTSMHSPA